jgi:hypothetical protein
MITTCMGYPCLMRKVFLTPLLIAGLLLLSSCSGNSGENSTQAKCAEIQRFVSDKRVEVNSILQSAEAARALGNWDVALDLATKFDNKMGEISTYIFADENCFLEQEIIDAKNWDGIEGNE